MVIITKTNDGLKKHPGEREWEERGENGYERTIGGIFVVMKLLCIFTVVVDT